MSIVQAIVLGAVQGLTEFIPVSSSAHLIIVPWLFGWTDVFDDPAAKQTFDVALHVGTFFAALIFFRVEVRHLIVSAWRSATRRRIESFDDKLVWLLVVASIPAAVFGFFFEGFIAEDLSQPWVVAITLACFGLLMLVIDRRAANDRPFESAGWGDSLVIGFAQAIALIPGTSRSGVTITAGVFRNLEREAAVRFSFLMSIPIIGGAALYKSLELISEGFGDAIGAGQFAAGMVAAFVTGYVAIAWMLQFLRTGTLTPFVIYRLALAAFILIVIGTGLRPPTI